MTSTIRSTIHTTIIVTHSVAVIPLQQLQAHSFTNTIITQTTTTTVHHTSTIASGGVATPTTFTLKTSNGYYVTLASVAGGGFYANQTTATNAEVFKFVGTQLWAITGSNQYYHYISVGTPAGESASEDWFQLEVSKSGSDGNRPALCCALTTGLRLTCGKGEIFGWCYKGAIYEGPAAAETADYDYTALGCTAVTLTAVPVVH